MQGAEERRLRRMQKYAASLPPRSLHSRRRVAERSLARLWREGNPPEADERLRTCPRGSRDDALVVIRARFIP